MSAIRNDESLWEAAWERFNSKLRRLADEVGAGDPEIRWKSDRHRTTLIPFAALASFERGGQQKIVVSLESRQQEGRLVLSADIATGGASILARGPSTAILSDGDEFAVRDQIQEFLDRFEAFLDVNRDLLSQHLS